MGDAKIVQAAHGAAAALALNSQAMATARPISGSASAPATPHNGGLGPSAPVPQLSPTPGGGGRSGRRLHTKVLEELKHAATRKSPAVNPSAAQSGHAAALPPPLNLQSMSSSDVLSDGSSMQDSVALDGSSPRIPAPGGKSKTCGICDRSFTVFRAKHTCKVCGRKICDDCSKNRVKLNRRLERRRGSRLCDSCARDHIQLSTPLVSPSQIHIPEEEHDGTDDSSRGNVLSKSGDAAEVTGNMQARLQRAVSSIKSSSSRVFPSESTPAEEGDSFLRPRHWISLGVVAGMVLARFLRSSFQAEARGVLFVLWSLTHWIDHVASLRIIGPYLLGLVMYDEVTARRSPHYNTVLSATVPSSSTRRTRTRSAVLESRSRTVLSSSTKNIPGSTSLRGPHEHDDEELEVQVGEKHVDDGFTFDKLHSALSDCTTKNRTEDGDMKMSGFLVACDNVCGFILVFGRATAFAASTVTGYMSTITTNLAAWPVPDGSAATLFSWKEQSVRAVVAREVELHVAATGGKKKPSCCRCVLRLLWFIEFVEACVRYTLLESMDDHCAAGASKAYEETIGARHPWIIRKGVNSALASLPTRSAILKALNLHELSPEESLAQLKKVQTHMRSVIDDVTGLLKEHQLLDIK